MGSSKSLTRQQRIAPDPVGRVDLPELHRPQQSLARRPYHAEGVRALHYRARHFVRRLLLDLRAAPTRGHLRLARRSLQCPPRPGRGAGRFGPLATVLTGVLSGFTALFAVRLLVGAGESVAYPCYSRIFATDIPSEHRGIANALIDAGSKLGPGIGTLLGGLLLATVGWRMFFVVLGVVSLLWLVPWSTQLTRRGTTAPPPTAVGPSTLEILSKRSAWGAFFGHFCGNYFWFFLLTWLPTYLVNERGFTNAAHDPHYFDLFLPDRRYHCLCRLDFRPLDRPRRLPHAGPQDGRDGRPHRLDDYSPRCNRHRSARRTGPSPGCLHVIWHLRIESLGDHPDARRTAGRRPMDQPTERSRQSLRHRRFLAHRGRRRTDQIFVLPFAIAGGTASSAPYSGVL